MTSTTLTSPAMRGIMERLLGRRLTPDDGLPMDLIERTEERLGLKIPAPLKDLYHLAGANRLFMRGFQRFALPSRLEQHGDLLVFLGESQGGYGWGVNAVGSVFQVDAEGRDPVGITLGKFLENNLYYQVARGAECEYPSHLPPAELPTLLEKDDWLLVVNDDGLVIHALGPYLLWYFVEDDAIVDDEITISSVIEVPPAWMERYALEEL